MKHEFTQKVYYADTDAYGVVWHGSYLRWMEKGRVDLCDELGLDLTELVKGDIALPVTNMNVKFKASARLNEKVLVETWIAKLSPLTVTFGQTVKNAETETLYIQAEFEVVAISNDGKLYRRLPEQLKTAFERALQCNV